MTLLTRRRPRPAPRPFVKLTRAQLEAQLEHLRGQINRQIAARRAHADWVAAWLEQRAAAYRNDAQHLDRLGVVGHPLTAEQRRVIAHELEQLAIDVEKGPQ